MAIINKKDLFLYDESKYFQKFLSRNGDEFGLRFGNQHDAKTISTIFREIYGYKYIDPRVYNITHLKKELLKKNNFWFIGELLETKEIAGIGLIEKKKYIAHTSKAMTRKKFQGRGVTTKIGAAGLISITKMPEFKDVLKIDTEVRATKIRAQKLNQNAGAINFALIPAHINFGDKRNFKINENKPFPPKEEEAAIFYSIILKNLWRRRENKIYLIDDENFIFFHNYVKNQCKKMKDDIVIIEKNSLNKNHELYGVSKDQYNGIINLYGNIKEKSLKHFLNMYQKWRIILWKIPTTQNGVHSMALALKKGFNIVGYDVGFTNVNWTLYDSVILAYYPNGGSNLLKVKCLDENKPLYNKIREIFFSCIN